MLNLLEESLVVVRMKDEMDQNEGNQSQGNVATHPEEKFLLLALHFFVLVLRW